MSSFISRSAASSSFLALFTSSKASVTVGRVGAGLVDTSGSAAVLRRASKAASAFLSDNFLVDSWRGATVAVGSFLKGRNGLLVGTVVVVVVVMVAVVVEVVGAGVGLPNLLLPLTLILLGVPLLAAVSDWLEFFLMVILLLAGSPPLTGFSSGRLDSAFCLFWLLAGVGANFLAPTLVFENRLSCGGCFVSSAGRLFSCCLLASRAGRNLLKNGFLVVVVVVGAEVVVEGVSVDLKLTLTICSLGLLKPLGSLTVLTREIPLNGELTSSGSPSIAALISGLVNFSTGLSTVGMSLIRVLCSFLGGCLKSVCLSVTFSTSSSSAGFLELKGRLRLILF